MPERALELDSKHTALVLIDLQTSPKDHESDRQILSVHASGRPPCGDKPAMMPAIALAVAVSTPTPRARWRLGNRLDPAH